MSEGWQFVERTELERARFALGIAQRDYEARHNPLPAVREGLPFCPHGGDRSNQVEWWRNYQDPERGLEPPTDVTLRNDIREMIRNHVQREVDHSPPEDRAGLMANFSARVDELWSWREVVLANDHQYWRVEAIHYILQAGAQGIPQLPEVQAGIYWDSTDPSYWWAIARRFVEARGSWLNRHEIQSTEYWQTENRYIRAVLRRIGLPPAPPRRRRPALELPPGHPPNLHEQGSVYPSGVRRSARIAGRQPDSQPTGSIPQVVRRSARIAARGPPPGPSTTTGPPTTTGRKRRVEDTARGVAVAGRAKRTKA